MLIDTADSEAAAGELGAVSVFRPSAPSTANEIPTVLANYGTESSRSKRRVNSA
jgi:hypothetical protein